MSSVEPRLWTRSDPRTNGHFHQQIDPGKLGFFLTLDMDVDLAVFQLRDVWSTMTAASEHTTRIDIMPWLSKMTLDVIGLAGMSFTKELPSTTK
jgi:hypothetical protein